MKSSFLRMVCLTLILTATSSAAELGQLVQTKYPGVAGASAEHVFIDQSSAKLVPLLSASSAPDSLPYVLVPDDRYVTELARSVGYAGKPENLIQVRGRKTAVLKTSEIQLKMAKPASAFLNYPGIQGKPANYIVIDGVVTVLVKKSEYSSYLKSHVGVADLPANYVMDDSKVIQTIPVDDVEFAPLFFQQVSPQTEIGNGKTNGAAAINANGLKALREAPGNALEKSDKSAINGALAAPAK